MIETDALLRLLQDYQKGSRAYFKHAVHGWSMAEASSDATVSSNAVQILFKDVDSGEAIDFKLPLSKINSASDLPPLKNPDFMDHVDDLSLLSHLHEPAVFWGIKNRFLSKQIYTYSGMVLIAMNPFERVNIYTDEIMRKFGGKKRAEMTPHIYGIAEECYRAMLEGKNQSVVVSGESGAGKTQSTRYIMQYLAAVDSLTDSEFSSLRSETEEAVLASNPILESFGNAKTTRNDNSSRFGKFVQLFFSNPYSGKVHITGAKVQTYLLERSRLIYQPDTERNYHIFYQLCAAAPLAEKKMLGLTAWKNFAYLRQGNSGVIRNVNDVEEFRTTQEALSTAGVPVALQWEIFRICAALLHIGNIEIAPNRDAASCSEIDAALIKCTELLGINSSEFIHWITKKQNIIRGEKFVKNVKSEAAVAARDSVTKVIYTKLFDWLVKTINKNLMRDSTDSQQFMGVLDIYGFEHFTTNSFEQFCINYANEKLQQEFNAHVFRIEQEGYIQEGIQWTMIEFTDNKQCIELIEGKLGILALLDEESRLQNGTDANLVTKLNTHFATPAQKFYAKPRFGTTDFVVKHYAVSVQYASHNFIDKNKDSMSDELKQVLAKSTNPFLRELLADDQVSAIAAVPPGKVAGKASAKTPTLGSVFKASLQDLMATMRKTESHYIRCIKPNMAKEPFQFEGAMVLSQLQACGVLETIKISNAGYPNKLEYAIFATRYGLLVDAVSRTTFDNKALTVKIVTSVLTDASKYQFGKTKVFLKNGQIAFFENRRKDRVRHLVVFTQKNFKRTIVQRNYERTKAATITIQTFARNFLARNRRTEIKKSQSAIVIQSLWRANRARVKFVKQLSLIIRLQCAIRIRTARNTRQSLPMRASATAVSLENTLSTLTKTVVVQVDQIVALQSKVGSYESQINNWKGKYEAASSEIGTLKEEIVDLKAERDMYKEERDFFANTLSNCIQDGLLAPFGDFPFIPDAKEDSCTVARFSLPESKLKPEWTERRESILAHARVSFAPLARGNEFRDSLISSLKTQNEFLKCTVESLRSVQHRSSIYQVGIRSKSIYEEDDILAEAERERQKALLNRRITNRYSVMRRPPPAVKSPEDP
ncbi:Myosin type-2 heavy chain 1 [Chytriomyces hyalinus]|nr:Myosin type-2 heavy chain 1 [Chytriomyces hyalinus]